MESMNLTQEEADLVRRSRDTRGGEQAKQERAAYLCTKKGTLTEAEAEELRVFIAESLRT